MTRMHYLVVQATPKPENDDARAAGVAGAYVRCWIDFPLADGARMLAAYYIDEAGWSANVINEITTVGAHDYTDMPDTRQYLEEAEERGVSLVFLPYQEEDD